jgi:hypothetical protein
MKVLDY